MTITRRVLSASALAVLASASPAAASSPTRTVTRVVAVVNPKSWNAPCPAALTFTGTIFVSRHPATVTYRWERSDGARGQVQTLTINASGEGLPLKKKSPPAGAGGLGGRGGIGLSAR